jgi:hypothetical protein
MPRRNQVTRQWRLQLGWVVRTIWPDLEVLLVGGFPIYNERQVDAHRSIWRTRGEFKRRLESKCIRIRRLVDLAEVAAPTNSVTDSKIGSNRWTTS